jgi:hypothetical protein
MRYENQELDGLTVNLDNDEVIGCHLVNCRVLIGGKRMPVYSNNHTEDCAFHFSAAAQVTIGMLRRMLRVPGLREMVLAELDLLSGDSPTLH